MESIGPARPPGSLRRAGLADDMCGGPYGLYRPSAMPSGDASMHHGFVDRSCSKRLNISVF